MKYELLLYAGNKVLTAINVDGKNIQYISMSGNIEHPADDISGFYEHLLDYYNVDDLSELNSGVRIINGGTSKKNIDFFNKKFIKVDDFSLWRVEELLPIIMIQKSMIERNESVKVRVYDSCYEVTADSSFNISVDAITESDKVLTLEDFTVMNNFNGSAFHSNTDEVKLLRAELYESRHIINDMKEKAREAEKAIYDLNRSLKNITNYQVGTIIEFGVYDHKPIRWKILENKIDSVYIFCEYNLCDRVFTENKSNIWKNSNLRKWLNGEFYNCSFNDKEKAKILAFNDDLVTLLSAEEVERLNVIDVLKKESIWWLRSPDPYYDPSLLMSVYEFEHRLPKPYGSPKPKLSRLAETMTRINPHGVDREMTRALCAGPQGVCCDGRYVDNSLGVRPALHLSLN